MSFASDELANDDVNMMAMTMIIIINNSSNDDDAVVEWMNAMDGWIVSNSEGVLSSGHVKQKMTGANSEWYLNFLHEIYYYTMSFHVL